MQIHEELVGFEASAGDFLAIRVTGRRVDRTQRAVRGRRPTKDTEEMGDTEILEEIADATAGVEQFDISGAMSVALLAESEAEPREHAQERAVHEVAFRQVENETSL